VKSLRRIAGLLLALALLLVCVPVGAPEGQAASTGEAIMGDLNDDGLVTDADVIYLLWYTVFPEDYPVGDKFVDFNNDSLVTDADVIWLLWHTVFPEDYPLENTRVFRVGYGKEDITPEESVPMGGYGRSDQRMSTGILSCLWATCVAITDADGNTILLMSVDLCNSLEASRAAPSISEATGVPVENIVISATHTHSSPDFSYTHMPAVSRALDKVHNGLKKAAITAMEDRKPAQMYGASVETANMNFVRHYLMNDGTYCGDNFGSTASGYKAHASEADPTMQLIKFTREGDNDIILTNFQTHPHRTGGSQKFDISADIVGEYRAAMEKDLGVEVIYFSGAGGNLNPTSRISRENVAKDYKEHGKMLANYAKSAQYAPLNTGKVQASKMSFEAKVNHADDAYAAVCADLRARWDRGELTTAQVIKLGAEAGIKLNSPYHAGAIRNRANMPESSTFPIWAYSFGDVGFVAAPYEMFDTNGVFIKEKSPFEYTFISTIANKTNGYFPSDYGFSYGCYEVDTTSYVRGTAERLADEYIKMLTAQFANK